MRTVIVISFVASFIYMILAHFTSMVTNSELNTSIAIVVMVLGIISEGIRILSLKKRSSDDKVKELTPEEMKAYEGIEFHNDFSKVPAGEPDAINPKPVNYAAVDIYHEINNTVINDMKNAGLEIKKDENK